MVGIVARKEMTEMLRDGRFRWAGGIVFALLLGALALGWQHYREVNAQHELARRATRQQWLNQGVKNPHSAAHYGVYAFKPKMPLSLVDQGVDPWVGVTAFLEAHKQNDFKYRPAQDSTAIQRFGELTGAAVLQLLIPLVIILLTFPAFAAEREQGTLRQLLSLGVKPQTLAWGKALGIGSALALLLVPATVLGVVSLALSAENGAFQTSIWRMALMSAVYLTYFAAILAISLTVSARARCSRVALVALLGFWIFNGLIAPRVVADIAKTVHRTPSAFEFEQQIETALKNGIDGHDPADRRTAELRAAVLKKYNVSSMRDLPVSFQGISLQAGEDHGDQVFDHYYSELWDTFQQQERVHQVASLLAPVLAVRSLSMSLAGTDFAEHAHFARAAEDYRRVIQRVMNEDITKNGKTEGPYLQGADLWKRVPEFAYQEPPLSWVVARESFSLFLLGFWTAAAIALAWDSTRRLRVD
jgi:ABC-2 type transport system permease protein